MFDLDKMLYIYQGHDYKKRYLLEGEDRKKVEQDVEILNAILQANKELFGDFPDVFIPKLTYDPEQDFTFTFLREKLKTPTGKDAKYPYYVNFKSDNSNLEGIEKIDYTPFILADTFGEIYYFPNGEIGKARVIMWRKGSCKIAKFKLENGKLIISKLESKF